MKPKLAAIGLSTALLCACATNEIGIDTSAGDLSGFLQGAGASSMKRAQELWIAGFASHQPRVTINYQDSGSGAGRDSFASGGADFAGSDRALTIQENVAGSFQGCAEHAHAINLPVYISPIALVFNLEGVDALDLSPTVAAKIFAGQITRWDDPEIAALNPTVELPSVAITVVHRSDKSGTTETLTSWLASAAPQVWTSGASQEWAGVGGDAAEGTAGILATVDAANGTLGYADLAQAKPRTLVSINQVAPSPEAAGAAVAASQIEAGRLPGDLAVDLDRTAEGYPVVLVSYVIACSAYHEAATGELVRQFLGFVASAEGQASAAEQVGTAPLPEALREQVLAAIASID